VRARWLPRAPSLAVLVATVAAIAPDQGGQLLWITQGVQLAREAVAHGSDASYLAFEAPVFNAIAAWAALLYTVAAVAWSVAFSRAGAWSANLTRLSLAVWSVFALVSVAPLLPSPLRPPPSVLSAGNALAFVMMQVWFALLLERVMRRSRAMQTHGRTAPWRAPKALRFGAVYEAVAHSLLLRQFCRWLPFFEFRSDITNVLYANYLVPAAALEPCVPEGLTLQRLGADRSWAVFTFLSYRHGHFGPAIAGPFRRWFSSPVQTNWRIYVSDPHTQRDGIYFVTNAVTTRLHALGARLMAENMPMHLLADGQVERAATGTVHLRLEPGGGSAPDARATLEPTTEHALPADWAACFTDYDAMLAYLVPQDLSLATAPWLRETIAAEIELKIALDTCEPLTGQVGSRAAERIVGPKKALCFWIPRVTLRFHHEHREAWPDEHAERP